VGYLKTSLLRIPLGYLARRGVYGLFVRILNTVIAEHPDNSKTSASDQMTILALSPEGFRGDLEALAKSGKCRVLVMSSSWQYRILYFFCQQGLRPRGYLNPEPGSAEMNGKMALQAFYRAVLPSVFQHHGIDCVISYHIRVPADVDWGIAAKDLGTPYVVLYREGLMASSVALHSTMATLFSRFGFWGSHLVVHNESCRDLCIDKGLVEADAVSALGCIRMDDFINKAAVAKSIKPARKKVILFPLGLKEGGSFDLNLLPFFNGVHVTLAKLARKYPDIDFVFKPKPKVYPSWRKLVDAAFAEAGIDVRQLPNLVMDANLDAQKLIVESSVVCGINSTTILEAALAGKPVIVPYFKQLRQDPYVDHIKFVEAFEYLDVAEGTESFSDLIEQKLVNPEISQADMAGRRTIFKKYVSDPNGGALDLYIELLQEHVDRARSGRAQKTAMRPDGRVVGQPVGVENE